MNENLEFICYKKNSEGKTIVEVRFIHHTDSFVMDKNSLEIRLFNLQKSNYSCDVSKNILKNWPI